MRSLSLRWFALLLVVHAVPMASLGSQSPKSKGKAEKPKVEDKSGHNDVSAVLEIPSLGIRISYNDARRWAVDSDFVGQKPLPPGIQKNLARGKPLPPGIEKTRVPSGFFTRLPAHKDYEWRVAGTDLVLVANVDKLVAGILRDVFR